MGLVRDFGFVYIMMGLVGVLIVVMKDFGKLDIVFQSLYIGIGFVLLILDRFIKLSFDK